MKSKKTCNKDTVEIDDKMIARMLHKNAEETISDEQVTRVLEPISELILAGHFATYQRPQRQRRKLACIVGTLAAVMIVTLAGVYLINQNSVQEPMRNLIEVQPQGIPLAGELPDITGTETVRLVLLSEIDGSEINAAHAYEIPDGIWGIIATVYGEEIQAGTLIVEDGVVRLKQ